MDDGLVSTIIPVYNRPGMLREAVASVLAQTYNTIEVIIVDDGSNDDTPHTIEQLVANGQGLVKSVRQQNAGPGVARETGRQLAKGEFIQYLDSDDLLLPCKFEFQVGALRANSGSGVAYGKTRHYRVGENPSNAAARRTGDRCTSLVPSIFERPRMWFTPTPLYRSKLLDEVGAWLDLYLGEDIEYETRVATINPNLCYVDDFVADIRNHSGSRLVKNNQVSNKRQLKDLAIVYGKIYDYSRAAGLRSEDAAIQKMSRSLFLMARQCGTAGLADESKRLFYKAMAAAGSQRQKKLDFIMYRSLASAIGWAATGALFCNVIDTGRNRIRGILKHVLR